MKIYEITESKVEMCPEACCGKPVTECSCGPDCKHCDCYEKNKSVNEGAYQDGVSDGKQGRRNPRASSIYGPESGSYEKGYADGQKAGEADRAKRQQAYADEKAPVKAMSDDELGNHVADILRRMDYIRDIAGTKEYTSDHRAEFKELNHKFQLAAQVLSDRGMNWQEFRETTTSGAIATSMGGGNGFAGGGVGTISRAGTVKKKRKKKTNS